MDRLLDLVLWLAKSNVTDLNMPFLLLEETFETLTISACERVFDYLESRSAELLEVSVSKWIGAGINRSMS